ncbi:MAG: hypothetical protein WC675_05065 [Patescibacteria group bacterium]|jgi:hypothetical protein
MHNQAIIILAVAFGLLIILGIVSKVLVTKTKDGLKVKGWRRLFHLSLTIGILGFVYLFFAWQGVSLLASRFWLLILGLTALVWLGFIAKYLMWDVPKLRKGIEEKRKFEKYIP